MSCKIILLGAILASFCGAVWSSNINIDDTCSIGTGCMQCMSRRSADLERCQQLYFYITYSTGNSLSITNNRVEIDSYCNGDCPIVLATANFYCATATNIGVLLAMCPSYSVVPTGSFNVNPDLTSRCLSFTSQCLQCIGDDTNGATRCLQLFLLANNPNTSSTYSSRYCEDNCPVTLDSFSWYCGAGITDSYSYCEQNNGRYCGQLQTQPDFNTAVVDCSSNCDSNECASAITEYGCCLRQELGDRCTNVPDNCAFPVDASTTNIQVDSRCLVTRCSPCLSRDSDELERCEQLYSYLVAAEGLVSSQVTSIMQEFCSGNCPVLLLTSDYYCGLSTRLFLWQLCPSYDTIPSASVDIQASYGNGLTCAVSESCEECIGSRSPEPTRCLQLFLLTRHPNMTNFYVEEYCKGNCPLTLSTSEWYCETSDAVVAQYFEVCRRTNDDQYCATLTSQSDFTTAVSECVADCSSNACLAAQRRYQCCLNGPVPQACNVPICDVLTAHAPPPNLTPPLLITIFSALVYYIISI